MVMQRLREKPGEQQRLPVFTVCWDELFAFLRDLLKPKKARAWSALGNLDASVVTNYTKVFETEVPEGFEGHLAEISLYSSNPDTTQWFLEISGEEQFKDKRIYQSLTLSYGGLVIHTLQKIIVRAKTAGVATNIAASLTGNLQYLGSK